MLLLSCTDLGYGYDATPLFEGVSFELHAGDRVGFAVGDYDRSRWLVIDPVVVIDPPGGTEGGGEAASLLGRTTRVGGTSDDKAYAVAVNRQGQVYVAGETASLDFPITADGSKYQGTGVDAFVAKLDAGGTKVLTATYFGGEDVDVARGLAVDKNGAVYLAGYTRSKELPTQNAFQAVNNRYPTPAEATNAFVAKLDPAMALLQYGSYLGGTGGWDYTPTAPTQRSNERGDRAYAVAVDDAGRVGGLQGVQQVAHQPAGPLGRQPAVLGQHPLERHPGDVLQHHHRADRVVQRGVQQVDGVGVPEPPHRLHFAVEELAEPGVLQDVRLDPLDDHELLRVVQRVGDEHMGVAALAQEPVHQVPAADGRPDQRQPRVRLAARRPVAGEGVFAGQAGQPHRSVLVCLPPPPRSGGSPPNLSSGSAGRQTGPRPEAVADRPGPGAAGGEGAPAGIDATGGQGGGVGRAGVRLDGHRPPVLRGEQHQFAEPDGGRHGQPRPAWACGG